ncbi:NADPH reductase tah18 [Blastomyces silverae]|uniref:NADPH-dependent diflavin oxidoreductase 1 n=1 Tax=Blastomyces silverae TaxID=2060906 RepID=A0A0H1BGA7_9EURO|nr:NADPH reductase tah18 [Blastomyces silverae]
MASANSNNSEHASGRTAIILYGSETGNSQDIADELGRLAERLHFSAHVCELDAIKAESLNDYDVTIFAVSTTGQGDFPSNARIFWKSLLLKKLPPTFLQGVNFALFGLGDSSYPKFNWASRKLYKRLLQLGANELYPCGEADEQHPEGLEGTFVPWSLDLRKHLLDKFPLAPDQHPIPDDVQLPPKWVLAHRESSPVESTTTYPGIVLPKVQLGEQLEDGSIPSNFSHDPRPIPNTVSATLVANDRLTPQTHWQDVRHIILKISESIRYVPGDILQITPRNFAGDVNSLIAMMGWENDADTPLRFIPNPKYVSAKNLSSPEIPFLLNSPGFTLRNLLTDYLDIMAIPRRSFFSNIAHYTEDTMHKERLLEFTDPEYIDEFYDYTSRPRRSILEVLYEFESVKIPWQHVCAVFPVLRGRQFSLASGGKLKNPESLPDSNATSSGTRFDLLVAIVKYQTVIKKIREGVCTRYLAVLRPGSTLKVQVQKGGLNSSMRQLLEPTVLIGPGTGVAPLRSMLWEKAAMATTFRRKHGPDVPVPFGPIILLYGGRNRRADFFFEDEWDELKKVLDITILTAFSRDQKQKIYVQDRIREHAALFFRVLHDLNGTVYICGSSGKMPQAIREALIEGFQEFGKRESESGERQRYSREEAEKYLMDMEKVGRYKQETW